MITDKTECNNPLFGRILTAMVTPFTENGDVDYELAIKLSNYLFENGSDGIVLWYYWRISDSFMGGTA